jgi:hypothetical protein
MLALSLEGFRLYRVYAQSRGRPHVPSDSVQYLPVPASCTRHLPRSASHRSTCDLASILAPVTSPASAVIASALFLPPVTGHQSQVTKSCRIRTYEKCSHNSFRIRSSKTQDLKPFRIRTYEKTMGVGVLLVTRNPTKDFVPLLPDGTAIPGCLFQPSRASVHGSRSRNTGYVFLRTLRVRVILSRSLPFNSRLSTSS